MVGHWGHGGICEGASMQSCGAPVSWWAAERCHPGCSVLDGSATERSNPDKSKPLASPLLSTSAVVSGPVSSWCCPSSRSHLLLLMPLVLAFYLMPFFESSSLGSLSSLSARYCSHLRWLCPLSLYLAVLSSMLSTWCLWIKTIILFLLVSSCWRLASCLKYQSLIPFFGLSPCLWILLDATCIAYQWQTSCSELTGIQKADCNENQPRSACLQYLARVPFTSKELLLFVAVKGRQDYQPEHSRCNFKLIESVRRLRGAKNYSKLPVMQCWSPLHQGVLFAGLSDGRFILQ